MFFSLAFFCSTFLPQADDLALQTVRIDSVAKDSYRCLRVDSQGRLFVGARDALFVYEPTDGGYGPRKSLGKFPPINDIEMLGNDVYVLAATALYVVPRNGEGKPRKLLWGVPHGIDGSGFQSLAWGPEGDLYIALGDPIGSGRWGYWTFFNDTKTPYRGQGAVLRCKPDGSALQIVAEGLDQPRSLLFDRYWTLFACDRDKLVYVPPHARFGSSGADLLPAMGERAKARGWCYYDEPLLPAKVRHNLLSAGDNGIMRHALEPNGASFKTTEPILLERNGYRAITVGRGGQLFAITDHGDLVMLTTADAPDPHPYEATKATPEKLWSELSEPSWQRRYRAHLEILRRGGDPLKDANKRLLGARADDPALHHLIWLAARSGQGSLHLLGLVNHVDPLVRVQAIRALTEYPEQLREEPIFTKALLDENPQVQHAALSAFFSPKNAWSRPAQLAIERGPACSKDPYLRQSAALLLARQATRKQLDDLCASVDPAKRMAGVLAAGFRLTLPKTTLPLAQHLPLGKLSDEACVIDYVDGKVDLRDLGRIGSFTLAEHWKADKRLAEEELVFKLLRRMRDDEDEGVRLRARQFLEIIGQSAN